MDHLRDMDVTKLVFLSTAFWRSIRHQSSVAAAPEGFCPPQLLAV